MEWLGVPTPHSAAAGNTGLEVVVLDLSLSAVPPASLVTQGKLLTTKSHFLPLQAVENISSSHRLVKGIERECTGSI